MKGAAFAAAFGLFYYTVYSVMEYSSAQERDRMIRQANFEHKAWKGAMRKNRAEEKATVVNDLLQGMLCIKDNIPEEEYAKIMNTIDELKKYN